VLLVLSAAGSSRAQAPFLPVDPMPTAMEARLIGALETATEFDFVDIPLGDVAAFLSDAHQVSVMIDAPALEDAGVRSDAAVTLAVKGVQLRSGLRLMLDKLGLTYAIHNEVLMITTPAAARNMASTKVYDVSKVLGLVASADALARTLNESLPTAQAPMPEKPPVMTPPQVLASLDARETETPWRSITPYQQMLIVRDTTTGHERITDTLRALQASVIRRAAELQRAQEEALRSVTPPTQQTPPTEPQPEPPQPEQPNNGNPPNQPRANT
jgi:hypothetical protein